MYNFKMPFTLKDIIDGAKEILKNTIKTVASSGAQGKKTSLDEEFDTIDRKYASDGGSSKGGLGLVRLEYDAPGDDEIKETAKNALYGRFAAEKEKITDTAAKAYSALEDKKDSLFQSQGSRIKELDDYYDIRKNQAEKDAIKRGLARSSIITGKIEEFDRGRIENKAALTQETAKQLAEIDGLITDLENQKDAALKNSESAYAAELGGKIEELKGKRDEKLAEVIKYNNTVQEKEKKYADSAASKNTGSQTDTFIHEEKLAAAKKYYDTLPKQQALNEFLGNPSMKTHLGAYYGYMLNYLNNRK